jgi:hypothetical protein
MSVIVQTHFWLFEKLQKATTSLVTSGGVSVHPHGTTRTDFHEI